MINKANHKLKILDIGCGIGQNYSRFSKLGEYYGLDISPDNISYLQKKYPKVNIFVGDIAKNTLFKHKFDIIFCFDTLEHVSNLDLSLVNIKNLLKSNGKLVVEVPSKFSETLFTKINPDYPKEVGHLRSFDENEWTGIIEKQGFYLSLVKYLKFNDVLYLSYKFLKGKHIIDDMGQFDKEITNKDDEINSLIWQLSRGIPSSNTLLLDQFRLSQHNAPLFFKSSNEIYSQFFPKSYHFEFLLHPVTPKRIYANQKIVNSVHQKIISGYNLQIDLLKQQISLLQQRKDTDYHLNKIYSSKFYKIFNYLKLIFTGKTS